MTKTVLCAPVLALGAAFLAYGQTAAQPTKVGIIRIQDAIIGTKDGQKAAADLQARYEPKRKEIEKAQSDIAALRDKMQKGANTMSEEQRNQIAREIDSKTRTLNRQTEDAQAEYDQEQQKVLQELGGRLMAVLNKYAQDNGYAVIIDVNAANTPVLYAANSVDITDEIVALYDKNAPPAGTTAAPAAGAPKPAVPGASAPKPAPGGAARPAPAKPGAPK